MRPFIGRLEHMKKIIITYKFKLDPSRQDIAVLNKHLGCTRLIFNMFMDRMQEQRLQTGTCDGFFDQCKELTLLKKEDAFYFFNDVNSQSLQAALGLLKIADESHSAGRIGAPRHKSRKKKNSFIVPQHVRVQAGILFIPKFKGGIRLIKHREIQGDIKRCIITKTTLGEFFASIVCEKEHEPLKPTGKAVGLDMGLKNLAITSTGEKFENCSPTERYAGKLLKAQRHLARKQYGSKGWDRQRLKVVRVHKKIVNTRRDFAHKLSTVIIKSYDTVCVEDLNIAGLIKNPSLSRRIGDAGWGMLVRLLEQKAEWNNKQVVKIGRFFPSSKTCHHCGHINQDLKLPERQWTCPCGQVLDRDVNAAINILKEGQRIIGAGRSE